MHGLVKTLLWIDHSFIDAQVKEDAHISIVFDQSPLVDENAERQRDKDDVTAGLMQKWEYRVNGTANRKRRQRHVLQTVNLPTMSLWALRTVRSNAYPSDVTKTAR